MLKIKEAIIVEGKYDKVKLSSLVDTIIVETDGFRIFKNKEKLKFIKNLAENQGILIITDSDASGFMIRNYLKSCIGEDKIKHAYIPDVYGKEKRKSFPSKEGKLGVEGLNAEILLKAINNAGVKICKEEKRKIITKLDLYNDGIIGGDNSRKRRSMLIKSLMIPEHITTNSLIKVLNNTITYGEYKNLVYELGLYSI